ncbi:type II toxin-antitoxin system VapB family antitoxin [Nocardioides speluncae]|uniref:type II toxin-antitoxin system VapB family antitoxin n=1 Tax=Nocardioides speluncae TaxID=2670337 RepID=UPI00137B68A7|nr:type II toxin-antitoxin system VapB family antitoxin [Nocardioides speluncae]
MRTTVNIDDRLLEFAKERAHERHLTLGEMLEEALQRYLMTPIVEEYPELPVFEGGGGFLPGIDPSSNSSLYDAMDEGEDWVKLR